MNGVKIIKNRYKKEEDKGSSGAIVIFFRMDSHDRNMSTNTDKNGHGVSLRSFPVVIEKAVNAFLTM